MSGPSDKAVGHVADLRMFGNDGDWKNDLTIGEALEAAHDPALGLDRSVCLRDVVNLLRRQARHEGSDGKGYLDITANAIEREFGGGS